MNKSYSVSSCSVFQIYASLKGASIRGGVYLKISWLWGPLFEGEEHSKKWEFSRSIAVAPNYLHTCSFFSRQRRILFLRSFAFLFLFLITVFSRARSAALFPGCLGFLTIFSLSAGRAGFFSVKWKEPTDEIPTRSNSWNRRKIISVPAPHLLWYLSLRKKFWLFWILTIFLSFYISSKSFEKWYL